MDDLAGTAADDHADIDIDRILIIIMIMIRGWVGWFGGGRGWGVRLVNAERARRSRGPDRDRPSHVGAEPSHGAASGSSCCPERDLAQHAPSRCWPRCWSDSGAPEGRCGAFKRASRSHRARGPRGQGRFKSTRPCCCSFRSMDRWRCTRRPAHVPLGSAHSPSAPAAPSHRGSAKSGSARLCPRPAGCACSAQP